MPEPPDLESLFAPLSARDLDFDPPLEDAAGLELVRRDFAGTALGERIERAVSDAEGAGRDPRDEVLAILAREHLAVSHLLLARPDMMKVLAGRHLRRESQDNRPRIIAGAEVLRGRHPTWSDTRLADELASQRRLSPERIRRTLGEDRIEREAERVRRERPGLTESQVVDEMLAAGRVKAGKARIMKTFEDACRRQAHAAGKVAGR